MTPTEFTSFLGQISSKPLFVLNRNISLKTYVSLDLSNSNKALNTVNLSNSKEFEAYIFGIIKSKKMKVAYGGYGEVRTIYERSPHFNLLDGSSQRNIHLGMDLWIEAGTVIYAPLNGRIHSFKNNTNYGDYGPTIILKHNVNGIEFHTLYGHLSLKSIAYLKIGQIIKQGEPLATLGDASVNGDYPPHLHFQVIRDVQDFRGDYPGVCSKQDLTFYLNNCPDPNLLLKLQQ